MLTLSSPARFRSHARAAPGLEGLPFAFVLFSSLVLNERGPMDVEHAHQPKAPRGSSSSSRAFRTLGSGRFEAANIGAGRREQFRFSVVFKRRPGGASHLGVPYEY